MKEIVSIELSKELLMELDRMAEKYELTREEFIKKAIVTMMEDLDDEEWAQQVILEWEAEGDHETISWEEAMRELELEEEE